MTLSVCLVTRNEETNMGRVLRSVAGVADEVIVVDTGSTDRTAALAAQMGAQVRQFTWQDDFSAARNHALDQAKCDWILWLNPDEELVPAERDRMAAYLRKEDALGYVVPVQDILQADRPNHVSLTIQPRLFRRDAGARYVGRLHPSFAVALDELARRQGKRVYAADLMVRRHAYLSVPTPDKLRWSARLLELELRDRPGQLHYLIEYGRNLLRLNDPRGHEVLAEAAEQVLRTRDAPAAPTPTVGSLLEYLLTVSPEHSRCRLSSDESKELSLRWFRHCPPVIWALAQHLFLTGQYGEAAALLKDLLRMGRTGEYDHSAGFQPDIMGASALLNLGVRYTRLGDLDQAEYCFRQLFADPVHMVKARDRYAVVQALRAGQAIGGGPQKPRGDEPGTGS